MVSEMVSRMEGNLLIIKASRYIWRFQNNWYIYPWQNKTETTQESYNVILHSRILCWHNFIEKAEGPKAGFLFIFPFEDQGEDETAKFQSSKWRKLATRVINN